MRTSDRIERALRRITGAATASVFAMIGLGVLASRRRLRDGHSGLGTLFAKPSLLPLWLAVVGGMAFVGRRQWRPLPLRLPTPLERAAPLVGTPLVLAGVATVFWGRLTLGPMWDLSSSFGATIFPDHRLVTSGPFARVRHPIYAGWFLVALGDLLVFRNWTAVYMLPSVPSMLLRAWREEQVLGRRFGEEWRAYRRAVPGWVPRVRREDR